MSVVSDVVEDHDVAAPCDVGDRQEFLARLDGAERIDRIADDDHLRALSESCLDLVGLQSIAVRRIQFDRDDPGPTRLGRGHEVEIARIGNDHLVAFVEEGQIGVADAALGAFDTHDLEVRPQRPTKFLLRDQFLQFRQAVGRIDPQVFGCRRLVERLESRLRWAEMVRHVAHIEVSGAGDVVDAPRRHIVPVETENIDRGLEREVVAHPLGMMQQGFGSPGQEPILHF
jgi:hypothetical protein